MRKREFLDESLEGNWAIMCRAPRSDRIEDVVRNLVSSFWHDQTRPSSNTRDVMRYRIGPSIYENHIKHWLDITQFEMYMNFCNAYPHIKIGQTMFQRLKPYYVKINKFFETCCCRYHIEFDLYYQVFRKMREERCGFQNAPPKQASLFIKSILCDHENGPQINCIKGICETCGNLAKFPSRIEDTDLTKTVNCKR